MLLVAQMNQNTKQIALLSCEFIWLQKLILGLFDLKMDTTMILCDNQICDDREPCVSIVTHRNMVFLHMR